MGETKQRTTVKTRGDMIRRMPDSELASVILKLQIDTPACQNREECIELLKDDKSIPEAMCKRCIMYWLGSPVSVGEVEENRKLP